MLHVVTVLIEQPDGSIGQASCEFGGFRRDCRALAAWLAELRVELVVMESTGIYWKSVHAHLKNAGIAAWVVNAHFIKHVVLPDRERPSTFVDRMPDLMLVPGVEMLQHNSFPSGHTTAAFSLGLALTAIVASRSSALVLVLCAAGIGLSRVYLSQHFTEDVLAGATIGTVVTYLVYRWLSRSPFSGRPSNILS